MEWKDSVDFRKDYPGGYCENGDVYDGNGNRIGYVCGDGDFHVNDDPADSSTNEYYHMRRS